MASDLLKIQRLTDDNYFQWVVEAEVALCVKGLWGTVDEDADFCALELPQRTKLQRGSTRLPDSLHNPDNS